MSDPAEAFAAAGFRVDPADEADVQAGLRDVAGGRSVALSESELAEWCETGELPRSVEQRVNELECAASPKLSRGTPSNLQGSLLGSG